jgi:hypothetical protein
VDYIESIWCLFNFDAAFAETWISRAWRGRQPLTIRVVCFTEANSLTDWVEVNWDQIDREKHWRPTYSEQIK